MTWREEQIGDARLILGDCRDVLPTLGKVDVVVTSPPYNLVKDTCTAHAVKEITVKGRKQPVMTYAVDAGDGIEGAGGNIDWARRRVKGTGSGVNRALTRNLL